MAQVGEPDNDSSGCFRLIMIVGVVLIILIIAAGGFLAAVVVLFEPETGTATVIEPESTSTSPATPTLAGTEPLSATVDITATSLPAESTSTPSTTDLDTTPITPSAPQLEVIVSSANLRSGPGIDYEIIDVLFEGDIVDVLARNQDGFWFNVRLPNDLLGWLAASVAEPTDEEAMASDPIAGTIPAVGQPLPSGTDAPAQAPGDPASETVISLVADRSTISLGECVTIGWTVQNALTVRFQGQNVPHDGYRQDCPQETTTYVLDVEVTPGEWRGRSLTVTVLPG